MALPFRNATVKILKEVRPLLTARSRNIGTTPPKTKAYALTKEETQAYLPKGTPVGDLVPVYTSLASIGLAMTFGLYTAKHQLMHAPNVHLKKSRRETLPEVVEPLHVIHESEDFLNKSFFRKVAHIQKKYPYVAWPFLTTKLGGVVANVVKYTPGIAKVKALKRAGVNPV